MKYNYTVIIPHKNTPDLLRKCLDSIPERSDVQIIVVDDNSSSELVDFNDFPGTSRKDTIVVFDKSNLGAGNARNVALSMIEDTKWLIFADADDYFTDYLSTAMDKYIDADYDMVYFKRHSVYVGTDTPANRHQYANQRVDNLLKDGNPDVIRLKDVGPVCKFLKYELVQKHNITFEAIPYANDVNFFVRAGHYTRKLSVDVNSLYVVTEREGSLVKTVSKESIDCRYNAAVRASKFLESVGDGIYHTNLFSYCYRYSKISRKLSIRCFFVSLLHTPIKYWFGDIKKCLEFLFSKRQII